MGSCTFSQKRVTMWKLKSLRHLNRKMLATDVQCIGADQPDKVIGSPASVSVDERLPLFKTRATFFAITSSKG